MRHNNAILFSLFNLLLSLLLPLPLAFFSVSLHHLFIIVGKHWVILVCQWDENITGGETAGNGVLGATQMAGKEGPMFTNFLLGASSQNRRQDWFAGKDSNLQPRSSMRRHV